MIADNLKTIQSKLPNDVKLIVVTKHQTLDDIKEVYDCGYRAFGENRVQDLLERNEQLPDDIEWHLIGHLQTNKVKYVVPFVHLIHSVHNLKLLKEINNTFLNRNNFSLFSSPKFFFFFFFFGDI